MDNQPQNLSIGRNLKIALFHLGSGMADILATGTWNRIMISDLGFSATPIGLLLSLRYFLAPLGVWAGRMSDQRTVAGYRRLFWIWFGRALMVASMIGLGVATASLARGVEASLMMWAAITVSLLLFSLGYSFSGGTFLALVYDRTPEHQRGRAVGIVWTFLLLGFTVGGILFALLLPQGEENVTRLDFTPDTLLNLFVIGALVMGVLTALGIGFLTERTTLKEDAAIGVIFAGFFALGVAMLSASGDYSIDLAHFLFGNLWG